MGTFTLKMTFVHFFGNIQYNHYILKQVKYTIRVLIVTFMCTRIAPHNILISLLALHEVPKLSEGQSHHYAFHSSSDYSHHFFSKFSALYKKGWLFNHLIFYVKTQIFKIC